MPYLTGEGGEWAFIKFLQSTISAEYLPCKYERALPVIKINRFAKALLRLPLKTRKAIRTLRYLAHNEFQHDSFTPSNVNLLGGSNLERLRRRTLGEREE